MSMVSIAIVLGAMGASPAKIPPISELAKVASGWTATVAARIDQSYAGWDVEIGDADNDGKNEVLVTGCPNSRLYCIKHQGATWSTRLLADNLAQQKPGMGLSVKVADLNGDGKNEVVLGTGEEKGGTAILYVMQTDGMKMQRKLECRPKENTSSFTHNLAIRDIDGDALKEIISAYCGYGEIMRYDVDAKIAQIEARKIHQLSGSGEESLLADVDNDGQVEYLIANGFRDGKARLEIFELKPDGELEAEPRVVIDGFDHTPCFYVSLQVGDVDNDGKNELIAGWKRSQKVNKTTLIGYRVETEAKPVYTFEQETEELDMGYFEKMMSIADVDNDDKNELVLSTRGDNQSENIGSQHLGRVYEYRIVQGKPERTQLLDFNETYAESVWLETGDADNDGHNEIVLATGKGNRTEPGVSYVVLLKKK